VASTWIDASEGDTEDRYIVHCTSYTEVRATAVNHPLKCSLTPRQVLGEVVEGAVVALEATLHRYHHITSGDTERVSAFLRIAERPSTQDGGRNTTLSVTMWRSWKTPTWSKWGSYTHPKRRTNIGRIRFQRRVIQLRVCQVPRTRVKWPRVSPDWTLREGTGERWMRYKTALHRE
jgi:hypothetical protein